MRAVTLLLALSTLATAVPAPLPQEIDFEAVDTVETPTVSVPLAIDTAFPISKYDPTAAAQEAAAEISFDPITPDKRETIKRAEDCTPKTGTGPSSEPDTPEAFSENPIYASAANDALAPVGYTPAFVNAQASVNEIGFLGLRTVSAYDPALCAARCDSNPYCRAFLIYFERDPVTSSTCVEDGNPASMTNIVCTFYGYPVAIETATNDGQWRGNFRVVIAGSNGYNRHQSPPPATNFTTPVPLPGAINAPLYNGVDTYMGVKIYPDGPYDPSQCAAACQAQTAYNKRHATDGIYKPCNFFNSYILSKSNAPLGTYCSFYSRSWGEEYATNFGQWRDSVRYDVSDSYGYSLEVPDYGGQEGPLETE